MNLRFELIILIAHLAPTLQWSSTGHQFVSWYAELCLDQSGRSYVASLLSTRRLKGATLRQRMMRASVMPDQNHWQHYKTSHYTITESEQCADPPSQLDCPQECIITAIGKFINIAASTSFSEEERVEAVIFLIHLIGDIHNPMHLGFAKDQGGNGITLLVPVRDDRGIQNLHHVWDYELLKDEKKMMSKEDYMADVKCIEDEPLAANFESAQSSTVFAQRIASEIFSQYTCKVAYFNIDGTAIPIGGSVDGEYLKSRKAIALELLKKAGVRLAQILNHIARLFHFRSRKEKKMAKSARSKSQKNKIFEISALLSAEEDSSASSHYGFPDNPKHRYETQNPGEPSLPVGEKKKNKPWWKRKAKTPVNDRTGSDNGKHDKPKDDSVMRI
jgi:hypothetical protein